MKVKLLAGLAVAALLVHQYMIWFYAPIAQSGPVQKIFYMHLPCSWWALMSFFVVFVASILYLFKRNDVFDRIAGAAAEIGVLFATLALITGSVWARAEWGHWWLWDPKLTTALIMWYVYAGYLVLRSTPMGRDRKALVCAVLGIVAFLDVPLVFFAAKLWGSAHPDGLARKGSGMEIRMWHTIFAGLIAFGFVWGGMLLARIRQLGKQADLEAQLVWDDE
ncbi:Cytochrome c assembly protein [Pseudodesulfovibrio profundus]|uniref:Heme exporter protein C n=1 Tax=Pseudodesulfovibrio profundus TaxID=57320 RepID=A0A2C8FEA1_9BACT|nr:cytochrome c biogenesis protein CcsA [Pseudodesulfovibrio profundus]MBC16475.1 cytochrome C biogenesis protein CcmC [Desulfovibrio sp.]SOB60787.1 Cytochrome c assembly protein [Pseudodesulfovibrio profundus]|tara:strand:+ start:42285 stop:42947 length:663 start_codon:yes stop_codon:yes gene_type:complete